jgi:hypothetical protein
LGSIFDPGASHAHTINSIIGHSHFVVKIRRDNILEDSLNALVRNTGANDMRKPMRVEFVNEPAIDEGGVIKEYFQLLLKEIFRAEYAMFIFNEDRRVYWFNGFSFESPINFELIGTLLGLASSN